ncbi:HAMP domain-containing sensor histidine kinase [Alteromonas sp. C1M14]|uniref:sensor histidine kinase n=1 Tax=Alteromonas sp. C1M14 TaxID=2841567 RepID=UPI001C084460|nr:HAMP domain-containing sensor histidine kinase [Alteromonas sp. C1M14]MBU2979467.1 HAMP domain-containing histidine kinase [Alteromonas sp. C1M14]
MIAIGTFTRSSSFRVGILFTALSFTGIFFVFYYWSVADTENNITETRQALAAERFAFEEIYRLGGEKAVKHSAQQRLTALQPTSFIGLEDADGNIFPSPLSALPVTDNVSGPTVMALPVNVYFNRLPEQDNGANRHHRVLVDSLSLGQLRLVIGKDVEHHYTRQFLGQALGGLFVVMLLAIAIISFLVALYVVNRINRMSTTASDIMDTGNLSARMEIDSNWDDLSRLAVVFNHTLAKIENSVKNIKQVSDNIAHDLRTPLSRLRSKLERLPDSHLRDDALHEADSLLAIFNSLLRIADVESERQRAGFSEVQLDLVVTDIVELYEPILDDIGISITTNIHPIAIEGDRHLLFQALSNLLDNSIKYAGEHCQIKVELSVVGERVIIGIFDSGPGLAAAQFSHLEKRFYRAEQSRTTPGNGLGLAMVSAVASLHYGKIWFVDDPLCTGSGFGTVISLPVRQKNGG